MNPNHCIENVALGFGETRTHGSWGSGPSSLADRKRRGYCWLATPTEGRRGGVARIATRRPRVRDSANQVTAWSIRRIFLRRTSRKAIGSAQVVRLSGPRRTICPKNVMASSALPSPINSAVRFATASAPASRTASAACYMARKLPNAPDAGPTRRSSVRNSRDHPRGSQICFRRWRVDLKACF
jgi:hypothetical protein